MSENNPLAEAEPSAGETAEKVHFPPHEPAKSGPIEDYFNNIQGGDLGNILGIPDPNENSDMNLARAFEKQFKQTEPPLQTQTPVQIESAPFDEFTAKEDLDDLTPGDGLAAVAPLNDNGAPVVLAEKPLPAEEKPKFRLRKSRSPNPGKTKPPSGQKRNPHKKSLPPGNICNPRKRSPPQRPCRAKNKPLLCRNLPGTFPQIKNLRRKRRPPRNPNRRKKKL